MMMMSSIMNKLQKKQLRILRRKREASFWILLKRISKKLSQNLDRKHQQSPLKSGKALKTKIMQLLMDLKANIIWT